MSWKGLLEICSCRQAIENSRRQLLLRTNILQKTVFGCPCYKRQLTVFWYFFSLCSAVVSSLKFLYTFNDYIFVFFFFVRSRHFAQGLSSLAYAHSAFRFFLECNCTMTTAIYISLECFFAAYRYDVMQPFKYV